MNGCSKADRGAPEFGDGQGRERLRHPCHGAFGCANGRQHYRDRGDSENNLDELKNQWAWSGFTTHDRKRCQMMARTALIYNWWAILRAEAITSRPLALHGIARWVRQAAPSGEWNREPFAAAEQPFPFTARLFLSNFQ